MNVEIGAEAALFPEKEYKNGIAVAVLNLFWEYINGKLFAVCIRTRCSLSWR
jgi:hypothetical protein